MNSKVGIIGQEEVERCCSLTRVVIPKAAVVVVDSRWVVEEEQREEHRVEGIAAQQRPHSIADSIEHMPRSHRRLHTDLHLLQQRSTEHTEQHSR